MGNNPAPSRREFLAATAAAAVAARGLAAPSTAAVTPKRYAIVGTGVRGCGMWGRDVVQKWPDAVEFVGLCDINHKRVEIAKQFIGVDCPTFTNFGEMCDKTKPEMLAITTVDATHTGYILEGL